MKSRGAKIVIVFAICISMNDGYVFKNWDKPLNFKFGEDTKITANYDVAVANDTAPAKVTAKPLTAKTGDEKSPMIPVAMIMSLMELGFMTISRRRQDN